MGSAGSSGLEAPRRVPARLLMTKEGDRVMELFPRLFKVTNNPIPLLFSMSLAVQLTPPASTR